MAVYQFRVNGPLSNIAVRTPILCSYALATPCSIRAVVYRATRTRIVCRAARDQPSGSRSTSVVYCAACMVRRVWCYVYRATRTACAAHAQHPHCTHTAHTHAHTVQVL
eukprot:1783278-Rhodomonas_salina.1